MQNQGFVPVPRDILDTELIKRPSIFTLYIYLLLKANHADVQKNGKTYRRNEHITSYQRIREDLGMAYRTISEALKYLQKHGYVRILKNTGKGTHIRIIPQNEKMSILSVEEFEKLDKQTKFDTFLAVFRQRVKLQSREDTKSYFVKASEEMLIRLYKYLVSKPEHTAESLDNWAAVAFDHFNF